MNIDLELLLSEVKKKRIVKTPGHDDFDGFWLKKFTSIHDILSLQLSKYREETIKKKKTLKRHQPQLLYTNNVSTYYMENPNSIDQGGDQLFYYAVNCFQKNRKGVSGGQEEQVIYLLWSRGGPIMTQHRNKW